MGLGFPITSVARSWPAISERSEYLSLSFLGFSFSAFQVGVACQGQSPSPNHSNIREGHLRQVQLIKEQLINNLKRLATVVTNKRVAYYSSNPSYRVDPLSQRDRHKGKCKIIVHQIRFKVALREQSYVLAPMVRSNDLLRIIKSLINPIPSQSSSTVRPHGSMSEAKECVSFLSVAITILKYPRLVKSRRSSKRAQRDDVVTLSSEVSTQ